MTIYDGASSAVVGGISTELPGVSELVYTPATDRVYCDVYSDTIFPLDCVTVRTGVPIELPFSSVEVIEVAGLNRMYVFPMWGRAIAVINCPEDTLSRIIPVPGIPKQPLRATEHNRIYFVQYEQPTGFYGLNCVTDSIDEYVMTDFFPALLGYAAGRIYFAEGERRAGWSPMILPDGSEWQRSIRAVIRSRCIRFRD